jgi:hypothetical protein
VLVGANKNCLFLVVKKIFGRSIFNMVKTLLNDKTFYTFAIPKKAGVCPMDYFAIANLFRTTRVLTKNNPGLPPTQVFTYL